MSFGALSDHGNDPPHPQFHTLLNRPFHAIKLEDGNHDSQVSGRSGRDNFAKFKLDPAIRDACDATTANAFPGRDIELLPHPATKHLREVLGMSTDQSSAMARDLVGNPATSGHSDFVRIIIPQLPVILSGARPLARERTCGAEG